ncbi:MAG: IS21 family transposase [Leptolyngbya sp. IPPAS B-1204]
MKRKQQGGLLPVAKFREILRLHELGYSQCQIAQSCAVARSTVQDYIRRATAKNLSYDQLRQLSDSEAQAALGKGRQKCEPREEPIDFAAVDAQLQHKGITLALLWQEGLDKRQWNCSYATFCRWYNQWRVRHQLSMRQVYKGGEKLFVDYCGLSVPVRDPETGTVTSAQIFVACLGASNYTYAEATPSQELPHWIGSHQRALAFLGGVPQCIVPDNLKSGVTDPCRYEPGINASPRSSPNTTVLPLFRLDRTNPVTKPRSKGSAGGRTTGAGPVAARAVQHAYRPQCRDCPEAEGVERADDARL